MKLTPRLQCVADKVKRGSFPADIGTDHAYIPICLVKNGICSKAIAADVRPGPLSRAEKNIRLYNLQEKIYIRKGSGLTPVVNDEIDCAIISGMGGYLICDILEDGKEKAEKIKYFILQPIQAPEAIREYLYKSGYRISNEQLVKEDEKIYQILVVEHGVDTIDDEIYFDIGKMLIENKDPLLGELIQKKIADTENVLHKISTHDSVNARQRIDECRYMLKRYEEVLKCL